MKKLDVVIPSYRRLEKLGRAVESVERARLHCNPVAVHLHLYFSDPTEAESAYVQYWSKPWVKVHLLTKEFKASDFWNTHIEGMTADALCYLTDDVELHEMCLVEGWNHLQNLDFDGVVGFNVENSLDGQPCKAAFGMVGKKFAGRFPDCQVFCPEYWCFYLDVELEEYASSLGRFFFAQQARMSHFHPEFEGGEPDECHKHHRRNKTKDIILHSVRREEKLLWGREFDLIGDDRSKINRKKQEMENE